MGFLKGSLGEVVLECNHSVTILVLIRRTRRQTIYSYLCSYFGAGVGTMMRTHPLAFFFVGAKNARRDALVSEGVQRAEGRATTVQKL